VHHRPLAFVSVLTLGDYLLWNWSLNGNHDVPALVSGLTLPPLAVAWLWLLALSLARLIAHYAHSSRVKDASGTRAADGARGSTMTTVLFDEGQAPAPASAFATASTPASASTAAAASSASSASTPSSGKLAA